jgi:hypothetical protein
VAKKKSLCLTQKGYVRSIGWEFVGELTGPFFPPADQAVYRQPKFYLGHDLEKAELAARRLEQLWREIEVLHRRTPAKQLVIAVSDQKIVHSTKTARGSIDGEVPGVHLLAAFATADAAVLGQLEVARSTNEHKAALRLLGVLPLAGKVVTADAMPTHAGVCDTITDAGGDYILAVKDNQETLHRDIRTLFEGDGTAFSPLPAAAVA